MLGATLWIENQTVTNTAQNANSASTRATPLANDLYGFSCFISVREWNVR